VFSRVRDAIRGQGFGVRAEEDPAFVFRLYSSDFEKPRRKKCADFLRSLKQFANEDGATVEVAYLPETAELDFGAIRTGAEQHGIAVDPEAPFRVLSAAAGDVNIPLLDLRPVLRELHSKGQQLSLFPDFHYTAAVSRAIGEAIWEQIKPPSNANTSRFDNTQQQLNYGNTKYHS
jgi:hypothetical protein